ATTTANEIDADLDERRDVAGELLRRSFPDSPALDDLGQSGVGLDPKRPRGGGAHALGDGNVAGDADAAVGAHNVRAGSREFLGALLGRVAHHGAVLILTGI